MTAFVIASEPEGQRADTNLVIASVAKQSIAAPTALDCFAPLAMTKWGLRHVHRGNRQGWEAPEHGCLQTRDHQAFGKCEFEGQGPAITLVIASVAKQSRATGTAVDCFAALAMTNGGVALLAMTGRS
ncbi:MAG: hypothetical protein U1E37_13880 [Sphingomonadaceae bacterium]